MRDKLKEKNYFDALINKRYKIIEKSNNKLLDGLVKTDRLAPVKKSLSDKYVSLFKAKYSRGDDLSFSINEDYKNAVCLMKEYWTETHLGLVYILENKKPTYLNQYNLTLFLSILDLLSVGVLVEEIDKEHFDIVVDLIDKDKVKDFLFESLIRSKFIERGEIKEESYQMFFGINEKYGRLKKIIDEENKEIAQQELKYFLEKEWYQSFKGTPLYDEHLNPHDTYVGYWCFIAAAIVKIKGLDDSSFRDNQYYPKDLVSNIIEEC